MKNYKKLLIKEFNKNSILFTDKQIEQIQYFIELLLKWNNIIKLISENDEYCIIQRHIIDSLLPYIAINKEHYKNIVDLGAGNGFPGVILAIFFPLKIITLIEKRNAKSSFLKQVKYNLQLKNIVVFDKDAKLFDYSKTDIIISRAFGDINKIKTIIKHSNFCGDIGVYKKHCIKIYSVPRRTL